MSMDTEIGVKLGQNPSVSLSLSPGPVETLPNSIIKPDSFCLGIGIGLGIGVGQCV